MLINYFLVFFSKKAAWQARKVSEAEAETFTDGSGQLIRSDLPPPRRLELEHIYEFLEIVKTSGCHLNWGGGRRFI